MIPSTHAWWVGSLCDHIVALLLHREIASLWNRWCADTEGGAPVRRPRRWPILEMVWTASSLQPPRDSTTSGINTTPHRPADLVVCSHFPFLSDPQGMSLSGCGTSQGKWLQSGNHSHVKGSRASPAPVREVNIRRTAACPWNEGWDLLSWC